eukprot:2660135-Pleurochrysis_carterae.AAC.3
MSSPLASTISASCAGHAAFAPHGQSFLHRLHAACLAVLLRGHFVVDCLHTTAWYIMFPVAQPS